MGSGSRARGKAIHANREGWLIAAAEVLVRDIIKPKADLKLPHYSLSFGFPKGHRGKRKAIGQCWDTVCAADGRAHIFICPSQDDPLRVLDILLHELIHAGTPGAKHQGEFITAARACGLVKPWTATTAGEELTAELKTTLKGLGRLPHGALVPILAPKPGSRLRLWECGCPVKVRVASDAFNATCGDCDESFEQVV